MEILSDFLKITLPAALVLFAMYSIVKSFLVKEYEKKLVDIKTQQTQVVLPIRLQAYERICLLLERIKPNNLITRVNEPTYTASMLHQRLLMEIRNEYQHNYSQQLYMSQQTWQYVSEAIENLIAQINTSAEKVPSDAKSIELARKIMETQLNQAQDYIYRALAQVKSEIQVLF